MISNEDKFAGIVLALSGCVVLSAMAHSFYVAYASSKWPSSKGTVTRSRTATRYIRYKKVLVADIEYKYTVGDALYVGTIVRQMQPECNDQLALETIKKYPIGGIVDVKFNPAHPNICVLETGAYRITFLFIPIPALFIIGGLILIFN